MSGHSFLPPSGASAWKHCAQWPQMNQRYPQDDTTESLEGTAAHWVFAEQLNERFPAAGTSAPNGVIVTEEMIEGADLFCSTVDERCTHGNMHIEEQVRIPLFSQAHEGSGDPSNRGYSRTPHGEECYGTPDLWSYRMGTRHLEIVDYKFGHGFVDEYFNPQGLLYMLGILDYLKVQIINPLLVTVSFTIVQPRCFHRGAPVRTHSYVVRDAALHLIALERAGDAALGPKPEARTNVECDHCPGRHACSALQEAAYSDAEFASDRQPHDLTPAAASLELRMLERAYERLGARVDGLRELTLANLRSGKRVPHHSLESGKGRRQWNVSTEQVITIGKMLGKDLSKVTAITPVQAEKIIDTTVINSYSQIIPGAAKLVAENNSKVSRIFGKGE